MLNTNSENSMSVRVSFQSTLLLSKIFVTVLVLQFGMCVFVFVHRRLMLQFDISDVTREGIGICCQLMMGQSSVPHYQQLEEFTARLAPGEVSVGVHVHVMCSHLHFTLCSLLPVDLCVDVLR